MSEYALLIDGTFKEIRQYPTKPVDIPHKNVTWHEVIREYGEPFVGLENDKWMIRQVDPSTLPPPTPTVPLSITPRQVRLLLLQKNLLTDVEIMISQQDDATKITWQYALEFKRNDPLLNQLATNLNLSQEQIDQFFIEAFEL